ncbi:MAG TPA: GNAT family N-acetyltransferase [Trebonia sp.]|nr:GNAT family N-acetyltransferase [Trebonia sp.]
MPSDSNGVPFPPVRRLGSGDLRHCVRLSVDRGWLPERAKWSLLLEVSEVFGIDAPDGGDGADGAGNGDGALAGVVVLTRYGADLASVGMMLVAARYGRRGLGRALMEHLLAEAGDATVTLFATDLGKPLYDKLGFRTIRRSAAFTGPFRAEPAEPAETPENAENAVTARAADNSKMRTRPAAAADMASIIDVDKAAFGADRSHLLRRLPAFAGQLLVLETGRGLAGFAAAWQNHTSTVIGPVVAPDGAAARRLIGDLAAGIRGQVRLDLDPDRPELPPWAVRHGLQPAGLNAVMAYGDRPPPGDPARLFTPISIALA